VQGRLAEELRLQARFCAATGSPFYGELLDVMADDVEAGGAVWAVLEPHAHESLDAAYRLRLLGGVHRMVLSGTAPALAAHFPTTGGDGDVEAMWPSYRDLLDAAPEMVVDALRRPPQTNEVGRSAALAGGLAVIARRTGLPLRLLEIGTSAALNLRCDGYWYEHDRASWGDPAAAVRFVDLWSPGRPPFASDLLIATRRGCDRDPIDATNADDALKLLSYVWPGQEERFETLRNALTIAAAVPVTIDRGDAVDWVPAQLAEPREGLTTVVMHSVFWQYLGTEAQASIVASLAAAGARATVDAPLAWLRLEPTPTSVPQLWLTTWPAPHAEGAETMLATAGFHAGPVNWLA
jgi:hypothetical protein